MQGGFFNGSGTNRINSAEYDFIYDSAGVRDYVTCKEWDVTKGVWNIIGSSPYYINGLILADFIIVKPLNMNGDYYVIVYPLWLCNFISDTIHIITLNTENIHENNFYLYQNPTTGNSKLIINNKSENCRITLNTIEGKQFLLYNGKIPGSDFFIMLNAENYDSGIYFISVQADSFTQKVAWIINK